MTPSAAHPGTNHSHEFQQTQTVHADVAKVYDILVDPAEQLKWNSLYLQASVHPDGPIRDGSRLTGKFKGSGRANVTFVDVVDNERFTHHSEMAIPGTSLRIGTFDHTYSVRPTADGTEVTQHVRFEPSAIGRLMTRSIIASFRRRLPASFDELRAYAEKPRD